LKPTKRQDLLIQQIIAEVLWSHLTVFAAEKPEDRNSD
jgi:hypothetical protein